MAHPSDLRPGSRPAPAGPAETHQDNFTGGKPNADAVVDEVAHCRAHGRPGSSRRQRRRDHSAC